MPSMHADSYDIKVRVIYKCCLLCAGCTTNQKVLSSRGAKFNLLQERPVGIVYYCMESGVNLPNGAAETGIQQVVERSVAFKLGTWIMPSAEQEISCLTIKSS